MIFELPAYMILDSVIKANERIVCRSATVFEDDTGEISWVDNGKLLPILEDEDE